MVSKQEFPFCNITTLPEVFHPTMLDHRWADAFGLQLRRLGAVAKLGGEPRGFSRTLDKNKGTLPSRGDGQGAHILQSFQL